MENNSLKQKIVFSQIAALIPWYRFDQIVKEFGGDYRYKKFKSRNHLFNVICSIDLQRRASGD